tara:strand:- start:165 stop:362 length:198 start_codon:yes stop_codon:yes gene_type:complete
MSVNELNINERKSESYCKTEKTCTHKIWQSKANVEIIKEEGDTKRIDRVLNRTKRSGARAQNNGI